MSSDSATNQVLLICGLPETLNTVAAENAIGALIRLSNGPVTD
jgi:hypothetical protein